jgi:hypothetical protein
LLITSTVIVPSHPSPYQEPVMEQKEQPVYVTKTRTVRVPKITYQEIEVPYQEQVMEGSIAQSSGFRV